MHKKHNGKHSGKKSDLETEDRNLSWKSIKVFLACFILVTYVIMIVFPPFSEHRNIETEGKLKKSLKKLLIPLYHPTANLRQRWRHNDGLFFLVTIVSINKKKYTKKTANNF